VLVGLLTRAIMDSHYEQTKPAMRVSRESHLSAARRIDRNKKMPDDDRIHRSDRLAFEKSRLSVLLIQALYGIRSDVLLLAEKRLPSIIPDPPMPRPLSACRSTLVPSALPMTRQLLCQQALIGFGQPALH
jgi:hypothetical protein